MNKEISLNDLASALAEKTGSDVKKCIDFITLLGRDVLEELNKYNSASIPNIGTFQKQTESTSTDDKKDEKVIFLPDERLKHKLSAKKDSASHTKAKADKKRPAILTTRNSSGNSYNNSIIVLIAIAAIMLTIIGLLFVSEFSLQNETPAETSSISTTLEPETENNATAIQPEDDESAVSEPIENTEEPAPTGVESQPTPNAQNEVSTTPNTDWAYTVKQDEWLWIISEDLYGKSYLWPLIFEANMSVNEDPDKILPGQLFTVPALEGSADDLTESDRERLKTAYLTVVEAYENAGKTAKANDYRIHAATF